jgi:hypothetical protein
MKTWEKTLHPRLKIDAESLRRLREELKGKQIGMTNTVRTKNKY